MAQQAHTYGRGKFICPQCKTILPDEMRQEGSPYCGACWTAIESHRNVEVVDSAVVAAAQTLMEVDPENRGSVRADIAMSAFIKGVGGEKELGRRMADRFNLVLDSPETSSKEARIWLFQAMKFAQKQQELDQDKRPDLSDIPEDELFATLKPLAAQMLIENPEFRAQVMAMVVEIEQKQALSLEMSA